MPAKVLSRTQGEWISNGMTVEGYEIHMGVTERPPTLKPLIYRSSDGSEEGARSQEGRIWGTYLHGLFDAPSFRRAFLTDLAPGRYSPSDSDTESSIDAFKDRQYDLLAEHFETYLDMDTLMRILEVNDL